LKTGDYGCLDQNGALHVAARRSERIVTGGENVDLSEVEKTLIGIPGVEEAIVFSVPDEEWGQIVAAAIIGDKDSHLDSADLSRILKATLSPYKIPRKWLFLNELPLLANGKPDLNGLSELLESSEKELD